MRPNTTKRLLQEGKPAFGTWLSFASIGVAEAMATAGWDWIVVDTEHGATGIETLAGMLSAIAHSASVPMCRVPWNDPQAIKRTLDAGALGIVVPMVNSAEDAAAAVRAARYPPLGIRSAGGGRWRYWAGSDYSQRANEEILVVVQIEHIDAVRRADEILSVPGVDAGFVGPSDLAWSMGLLPNGPGMGSPPHEEAIAAVAAAGRRTGTPVGIHALSAEEAARRAGEGFQFIACRTEASMMLSAAAADLKTIRAGVAARVGERA
ncbi:MAG: 2-dehydro-3-deoxyglucarate aldolase [Chloroflexi bacterium]|nr:2-dehydro-3-deoxyglucarate aldolase [Chloroflexota bacterium]